MTDFLETEGNGQELQGENETGHYLIKAKSVLTQSDVKHEEKNSNAPLTLPTWFTYLVTSNNTSTDLNQKIRHQIKEHQMFRATEKIDGLNQKNIISSLEIPSVSMMSGEERALAIKKARERAKEVLRQSKRVKKDETVKAEEGVQAADAPTAESDPQVESLLASLQQSLGLPAEALTDKKILKMPSAAMSKAEQRSVRQVRHQFFKDQALAARKKNSGLNKTQSPTAAAVVQVKPLSHRVLCKYWMEGKCTKGSSCTFSHSATPLRTPEDLRSEHSAQQIVCKYFIQGLCVKGDQCLYSHNLSRVPCKWYHGKGECQAGTMCKFSHDPVSDEIKERLTREAQLTMTKEEQANSNDLIHDKNTTMMSIAMASHQKSTMEEKPKALFMFKTRRCPTLEETLN